MDIIRKRPASTPGQTGNQKILPSITRSHRNEEIYLTSQDMERMQKHESKFKKGRKLKRIFSLFLILLFLLALGYGGFFFYKAYSISKKMNSLSQQSTSLSQDVRSMIAPIVPASSRQLEGQQNGRINILLLGAAGEHNPGGNLTDTIMVMNIDTANKKVALLSIPRDFYVNINNEQTPITTKINTLYQTGLRTGKGIDLIKQTVEKITGLQINYYLVLDFEGFKRIIDNMGGINVMVERDLFDSRYPGPNYSYETFSINKGFNFLDGQTALKYVRERHSDPEGDFGRAKRQQQVIQAVKNKLFSMQTFFNVARLNDVLNTLGDNIKTNIAFDDIDSFIALSKQIDTQNITNVVLDALKPDSLMKVSHVQIGNVAAFVLLPRVGNYSEIQDLTKNIFNQSEIKRRNVEISSENASIGIINQSGDNTIGEKIRKLLSEKLSMKNVHVLASSQNTITTQTKLYDNTNGAKIFTIDELVKKLPAKFINNNEAHDNSNDITIVLGKDLIDIYKYDEASIEEYNKAQDNE